MKNGRHPTWTWKSPNGGINLALPVMFGGFTVIFLITALHDGILTPLLFVMLLSVHLFVGILAFSFYYPFTKPRTLYGTHLFIPQIGELRVQKAYMDANGNFILLTDSESVFLLGVCVDGLEKTLQNAGIAIQRVKWLCKGFCILIDTLGDEFLKHLDERLTKREYGELLKTIGDLNGWDLHTIGKRLLQKLEKTFPLGWFGLLWLLLILYTTGRLVLFLLRYDYALIEHLGLRFHLFPYSIELAVTFLIWGMFTSMVMILFLQPWTEARYFFIQDLSGLWKKGRFAFLGMTGYWLVLFGVFLLRTYPFYYFRVFILLFVLTFLQGGVRSATPLAIWLDVVRYEGHYSAKEKSKETSYKVMEKLKEHDFFMKNLAIVKLREIINNWRKSYLHEADEQR